MECCSNDDGLVESLASVCCVNAENWSQTCTKCSKGKVMLGQLMSQTQRETALTVAGHLWAMHGACIIDLDDFAGELEGMRGLER